jgi:hypothetical protein
MWCLIVRQPYASLMAYGCKRWEFRSYDSTKRGMIAIASSRGPALKTASKELNVAAKHFPKGIVLATANLVNTFNATNKEIKESFTGTTQVRIHGKKFIVANEPLGEPVPDIELTIEDTNWKSYVWELHDVTPLSFPIALSKKSNSSWTTIEIEGSSLTRKHLISSYF